jgi:hypothetical protein
MAGTFTYAIPGLAILAILMRALLKIDRHRLLAWAVDHSGGLIGGFFMLGIGLLSLLRPDIMVRWLQSAYPKRELSEDNPSLVLFVRGLGVFISAFGLFIVAKA